MAWLNYTDDEVAVFHSEFENAANSALTQAKLDHAYEWVHHIRTQGSTTIPDFVLRNKSNKQWRLALEIKRTPSAVFSERYQIQAKGYAEVNNSYYVAGSPKYFAISNIERTILFAINGDRPPRECRILNGYWESGNFNNTSAGTHKTAFISNIVEILLAVTNNRQPQFEVVWPRYQQELYSQSESLFYNVEIQITEPNTLNWSLVRNYFAAPPDTESKRLFLLRCLLAEYLRGILNRYGHSRASFIPPISPDSSSIANTISALGHVDFNLLFDSESADLYQELSDKNILLQLEYYIQTLMQPPGIAQLANTRGDALELIETLLTFLYPPDKQDERGKVQTDPELANLLAALGISSVEDSTIDPCCGDGPLLIAAYTRLKDLGANREQCLTAILGIEADPIAARIASVRLALQEPAIIAPVPPIQVFHADMFADPKLIYNVDVVLMNPPFKRYEAQDVHPVPSALREYYKDQITTQGGQALTATGQPNLFNFYVEWIGTTMRDGATMAIILDNKWYHSRYGSTLKKYLLDNFAIKGIIEYPHDSFFKDWMIATSILIARKGIPDSEHEVQFVRSKVDPRGVDLHALSEAFHEAGAWPLDWTCRRVKQSALSNNEGWKRYFSADLTYDYRFSSWPTLDDLFARSRRGSLQKEGGGVKVYEFPFNLSNYGPRRLAKPNRAPFQTRKGASLSSDENQKLTNLARIIPADYRGYALQRADDISGYILTIEDVTVAETIEPPHLRAKSVRNYFRNDSRSGWTIEHNVALQQLKSNPQVGTYISEIENIVGLSNRVLNDEEQWVALREPYAGELIIPRKTRGGHRVHVNPFAINDTERQVRISSNFITFSGCVATDPSTGLDLNTSIRLIAAFLVSSFGQLQFEIEGYNREGLLSVEKHHLEKIRILDPRWINPESRQSILSAFDLVPYPVSATVLSYRQRERNALDDLFAEEIVRIHPNLDKTLLLDEVHQVLDEWIVARNA